MPLTPKNRKEEWLQGLVDHETTLTPKNRPEEWMKEIIDASGSGGGGGTGGGVLVCTSPDHGTTLNRTWKEINDAFSSSVVVFISEGEGYLQMLLATSVGFADELYYVGFTVFNDNGSFTKYYSVATENGYPIEELNG